MKYGSTHNAVCYMTKNVYKFFKQKIANLSVFLGKPGV